MTASPAEIPPRPAPQRRWWFHSGRPAVVPKLRAADVATSHSGGRVLLVNQHYWPDHAATAQHLTDLAEALAEQGHDVHVLCSRGGSRPGGPKRKRREVHNGVTIHRVGATSLGRGSTLRRVCDYSTFHAAALLKALRLPRFDVVVTLTTPPLIGVLGQGLRRLRGSCHVSWSMDLHPDASIALGRMNKRRALVRLASWASDEVSRRADRVVALGPYMADRLLAKGVRPQRMSVIPVWGRREDSCETPRSDHPLRRSLGLNDQFVLMYSGNHGLAHTFDEVAEAARRLRHRDDIVFVFVGDGPRYHEVAEAAAQFGLRNVRLLDFFPRDQLHLSLSLADAHLVTLRPEMAGICVPSKVYGAMASTRPIVYVGPEHSEVADTIRSAGCGVTCRPGDADGLVAAIEKLAADAALCRRMGDQGLAAFTAEYERDACCARWCWLIGELTRRPMSRPISTPHAPATPPAEHAVLARQ